MAIFATNNRDADNPILLWNMDQKNDFWDKVFWIIIDAKSCETIAYPFENRTMYGFGNCNNQDELYFMAYKPVTERFQYFLQDVTRTSG